MSAQFTFKIIFKTIYIRLQIKTKNISFTFPQHFHSKNILQPSRGRCVSPSVLILEMTSVLYKKIIKCYKKLHVGSI